MSVDYSSPDSDRNLANTSLNYKQQYWRKESLAVGWSLQEYTSLEHDFQQRNDGMELIGDWAVSPGVEEWQL